MTPLSTTQYHRYLMKIVDDNSCRVERSPLTVPSLDAVGVSSLMQC